MKSNNSQQRQSCWKLYDFMGYVLKDSCYHYYRFSNKCLMVSTG